MKKILISLLLIAGINLSASAKPWNASIDKAITDAGINKSVVSVSVKDVKTGKVLYQLNPDKPISPASTLKIVTTTTAIDTLGKDYEFTTALYKTANNEMQLKLSGDPFLKSRDLKNMMEAAKLKKIIEPKAFYIDDYAMDSIEWGEGWQWDDDLNPLMPKFSSYNLDENLLSIIVEPHKKGSPADIHTTTFYPITFMNLVTSGGKENNITLKRNNSISPDIITAEGNCANRTVMDIPINYPKRYFILRLEEAIRANKLGYYGGFKQRKTPASNMTLIYEIKRPLTDVVNYIFKESHNLAAETVFKIAGGKFVNNTGALKNSIKMFDDYCKKNGLNNESIKIVDGSGVSKNNLMTADFMTDFLVLQAKKADFEDYMALFPTPGEGTLKYRMLYFKDNLHAKTGTLSDISALAGYITTQKGRTAAFDIMINDSKSNEADKKAAEEYIVRAIYNKF